MLCLAEFVTTSLSQITATYIFVPIVQSVADSPIPDLLFGSTSQTATTLVGTLVGGVCSLKTGNTIQCSALGASVKAGLAVAISYMEPDTIETKTAGENHDTETHVEL